MACARLDIYEGGPSRQEVAATWLPYARACAHNFIRARPRLAHLLEDAKQEAAWAMWVAVSTWQPGGAPLRLLVAMYIRRRLRNYAKGVALREFATSLDDDRAGEGPNLHERVAGPSDTARAVDAADALEQLSEALVPARTLLRADGQPRVAHPRVELFLRVRVHGETMASVGQEFGMPRQRVHQLVKEVEPLYREWVEKVRAEAA